MKRVLVAAGSLLAIALINGGCTKKVNEGDTVIIIKQGQGTPLAEVGKTKLMLEDLREDFLSRQGSFRGSPNLNDDKARADYIDNQVLQEAMFKKAVELGYFEHAEVKREIKKLVVQRLVRDKLRCGTKSIYTNRRANEEPLR